MDNFSWLKENVWCETCQIPVPYVEQEYDMLFKTFVLTAYCHGRQQTMRFSAKSLREQSQKGPISAFPISHQDEQNHPWNR